MKLKFFVLFSLSLISVLAADQTWTSQVSDEMCGADHGAMAQQGKKLDPHECTLVCVKGGGKFVLVSEGKVFGIANQDFADLTKHADHNVKVTGSLESDGKTITVSKVDMNH